MNEKGMKSALSKLGREWSYSISETAEGSKAYHEYFGFFYDAKIEPMKLLGAYPESGEFVRPPYGAQFKVKGTSFVFNLVVCHIVYGNSDKVRVAEINNLGKVYRYFESLTGNKGLTIVVGDFNEEKVQDFASLIDLGDKDIIPVKGTTIGMRGPDHGYDHMFISKNLSPLVVKADVFYWTTDWVGTRKTVSDHFPVYCVINASK